jgi:glycosyltransferase involved in cell wall biosynthesis
MYNEEKYIQICIESIINQDFQDWELIIVDDFSQDFSFSIAESFASRDSRIKLMRNKVKGIIPALNLAFEKSKGVLITRMDADDIMPENKIGLLHQQLVDLGQGNIVSGKVKYFSESGLEDGFKRYEAWINERAYYRDIYKECTLPSACWMAFKKDIDKIGAFRNSRYPEDYDLLFRIYQNGLKIHGSDEILHFWRDHAERASRTDPNYRDQNFFDLKLYYFKMLDQQPHLPLFLWGAGKKGKQLAQLMISQNIAFKWVTQNQKKVGKHIYHQLIESTIELRSSAAKQIIVAISDKTFILRKDEIVRDVHAEENEYFYFC